MQNSGFGGCLGGIIFNILKYKTWTVQTAVEEKESPHELPQADYKVGCCVAPVKQAPNIHVPSTCSFRLCFRALPTMQTRDKENISEQELQLGWASLLVLLGERGKAE